MSKWRITGWSLFLALLIALGGVLHAWLPPQPRWVMRGSFIAEGLAPDGNTFRTLAVRPQDVPRRNNTSMLREPKGIAVQLWDVETGREVFNGLGNSGLRWEVAFAKNGRWLAAVGLQGE